MRRRAGFAAWIVLALAGAADAQDWSVDVSAGRLDYMALPADVGAAHLTGTMRYDATPWSWLYGSGSVPLGSRDPFWTAAGGGGRWRPARLNAPRAALAVDFAGESFLFRDRLVQQQGSGAGVDLFPLVRLAAGRGHLELGGGWRGHALSYAGVATRRGLVETRARIMQASATAAVALEAHARFVHADATTYPFVGGAIQFGGGDDSIQVRLQAGRWVGGVLSDPEWSAGLTLPLGGHGTLWAGVRQESPDPLYWNSARRTWNVGLTRRLGRRAPTALPAVAAPGTVTLRLQAGDAAGAALSVAGDFNGWTPIPMRREGDDWVVRLPLAPGVYHYAFRGADGRWFVPASVTGRRADGFGGHVAVLVVS